MREVVIALDLLLITVMKILRKLETGIVGPAKVTRFALQHAASVAAMFLTTEAAIADKPEENKPAMLDMGGMM